MPTVSQSIILQEQHKLTYVAYAPHSVIRFPTSNQAYITYIKMVEIGAKLEELGPTDEQLRH